MSDVNEDRLLEGMKDLAAECDVKIDNALKLFFSILNQEIYNFKHFAKREADTGSYKLVQELDLVTLPSKRSKELVKETNGINSERATAVNEILDSLTSVGQTHKYFHHCEDVPNRVLEKHKSMSNEVGRDGEFNSILQRKHQSSLQDLTTLRSQVEAIQEYSTKLQAVCFGEVIIDSQRNKLDTTGKLFRHFARKQMSTSERTRDVSGVELLMKDHQNI